MNVTFTDGDGLVLHTIWVRDSDEGFNASQVKLGTHLDNAAVTSGIGIARSVLAKHEATLCIACSTHTKEEGTVFCGACKVDVPIHEQKALMEGKPLGVRKCSNCDENLRQMGSAECNRCLKEQEEADRADETVRVCARCEERAALDNTDICKECLDEDGAAIRSDVGSYSDYGGL